MRHLVVTSPIYLPYKDALLVGVPTRRIPRPRFDTRLSHIAQDARGHVLFAARRPGRAPGPARRHRKRSTLHGAIALASPLVHTRYSALPTPDKYFLFPATSRLQHYRTGCRLIKEKVGSSGHLVA